jgi:hypothetical protein
MHYFHLAIEVLSGDNLFQAVLGDGVFFLLIRYHISYERKREEKCALLLPKPF